MSENNDLPATTSTVTVSNLVPTSQRKQLERKRHSNWYITINPNKAYPVDEEGKMSSEGLAYVEKFREALSKVFNPFTLGEYVDFGKPGTWTPEHIVEAGVEAVVERGEKTGKIHAHALFKVAHRSVLSLRYADLRRAISQAMEQDNVYMQVTLYRNASDTLQNYLNKNVIN